MSWGVIEERDEFDYFVAFHCVPMVMIDGELFPSGAHDVADTCPCHPFHGTRQDGLTIWTHHDPDHDKDKKQEIQ